jgi:type VI secretion system protein ImpK
MLRRTITDVSPHSLPIAVPRDPRQDSSLLLRQFREFYREVIRLRKAVEQTVEVGIGEPLAMGASAGASGGATTTTWTPSLVQPVWQQLLSILERQALEAGQTGGSFGFDIYREAQYLMAALADEIFLNTEWEGRVKWPLLETRLFQTHYAGEVIFQKLDRILQRRDPFYLDLATVYFLVLSLGFQGRYRGADDRSALDVYRRQLFITIHRRNPRLFSATTPLFPEAYDHTLEKVAPRKLPDRKNWLYVIAGILLLWLVISHISWKALSSEIDCLICRTTGAVCSCDAGGVK